MQFLLEELNSDRQNKLYFASNSYYCLICQQRPDMQKQQVIQGYTILRKLGEGSFGQVLLGKDKNQKCIAIKRISKEKVIKVNKLHEPFIQKQILRKLNASSNNFFIRKQSTYSDEEYVYLMLEYCEGGTLDSFIKKNPLIKMETIKKIIVRLVLMMENFHSKKLIHRDLKPSNILMTKEGYLKLSDFGTCYAPDEFFQPDVAQQIKAIKMMSENKKEENNRKMSEQDQISTNSSQRRYTFVGTACYMAPQLLSEDKCGSQSDLWALGCIFYQILNKKSPFFDQSEGMVWTKILNSEVTVYNNQQKQTTDDEKNLKDLIQKLLIKENQKRLGYGPNGYQQLKKHPFFNEVNWQQQAMDPIPQIAEFVALHLQQVELQLQKRKSQKDKVLFSGVVGKKMYFGNYKERTLVLHSFPKLVYYDTDSGEKKGEIVLSKSTPVKHDKKTFQVTTDKKSYYFKSKQSSEWVDMIKLSILNAFY